MARIFQQLVAAWDVLSTMTPTEYSAIRPSLGLSSGFQSFQYREIEFLLGNRNPAMLRPHASHPQRLAPLERALAGPSLYDEAVRLLARSGLEIAPERLALVLWPGAQYRTGQAFDLAEIVRLGHAAGAVVGFDHAHAVGNLPLRLHDSGADFAVWCHYKYLNGGPGAVGGCFVHERHAHTRRPRFAGWWGHDPDSRFLMGPEFVPARGAAGWQLSTTPALGLAPLRASLELFAEAGMDALRAKSVRLTGYLEGLIHARLADVLKVLTPGDPAQRGCQLSLRVRAGRSAGRDLFEYLDRRGITGDWREPDVIRASPAPLYNRFADALALVESVEDWCRER